MISAGERKWVAGVALATVVITTIPYALGFGLQGEEWRYSGFVFGVDDGNLYIAQMLSGSTGEWLFRSSYTAFEQRGAIVLLPYILLGKLASPPGLHGQLVALYHLFRWAAIFMYSFAAYNFISGFLSEIRYRRAALILAIFGGGLGFLKVLGVDASGWSGLPLEYYSPEAFGYLAVLGLPHIIAGRALLLWGLGAIVFVSSRESIWRTAGIVGGLWTILGLMQPLTVLVGWAILGGGLAAGWLAHWIWSKKGFDRPGEQQDLSTKTRAAVLAIGFSAPIPMYTFLAFQFDPYLKSWAAQNLILSPPPTDYLLAYGLILPFAIAGVVRVIRNRLSGGVFLTGWLALFPLLAYAPYIMQRRLPEGIWVCLVVVAMLALELNSPNSILCRLQHVLYIGIASSLVVTAGGLLTVSIPSRPLYVPAAEVRAYERIGAVAEQAFPVVLADYATSNPLPAWVPARVVIGHGPQSRDLNILQPQVEAFLEGTLSEDQALKLVSSQRVRFVLASPDHPLDLIDRFSFLKQIYSDDGYRIYQTTLSHQD